MRTGDCGIRCMANSEVRQVQSYDEWDEFVARSEQGTIFSSTTWLELMGQPYQIWGYYKGNNLIGGMANFDEPAPLTPFQGILVEPTNSKYVTEMSRHQEVAKALIPYCPDTFCNHYTFPDIRPFKWAGWNADVKYTYVVDLRDAGKLQDSLDRQTRYDINNVDSRPIPCSLADFYDLYYTTFMRKGLIPTASFLIVMRIYEQLGKDVTILDNGKAAVFAIRDSKRSYYIMGASAGKEGSARAVWSMMYAEGIVRPEIDLVGCNDELIARFKSGFAGKLMPYYEVSRG